MTPQEIHTQLVAKCGHLIQRYRDYLLKWDLEALERYAPAPFLHWTRESGTHMMFLHTIDQLPPAGVYVPYLFWRADREHIVRDTARFAIAVRRDREQLLTLHFDGSQLHTITPDRAVTIDRIYEQKMFDRFFRERRRWEVA